MAVVVCVEKCIFFPIACGKWQERPDAPLAEQHAENMSHRPEVLYLTDPRNIEITY